MNLDLSSLERASRSLQVAIDRSLESPNDLELRDGAIQRFEYTYELAWKMLKRRIEADSADPSGVDRMSYRDLVREGAERGLIAEPEAWYNYRSQRKLTSHACNESAASEVYACIPDFHEKVRALLSELQDRNHA